MNFLLAGPEPIQLGRSRQCEFFTRLKLSGGQEFTFGAVNVGQGHRANSNTRTGNMQSKASGQIELSGGNNMYSY